MKPLILSFFMVLLGYSLFFDDREEPQFGEQEQAVNLQSEPAVMEHRPDSANLFAKKVHPKVSDSFGKGAL